MIYMILLKELSDKSVGIGVSEKLGENYQLRKSARVILENEKGEMALQHLQSYGFYKLPGGGVDQSETVEEALVREVKEEVGCDCTITSPIGIVIEYRDKYKMIQISYCYVAKVVGEIGEAQFEEAEIEAGQTNIWVKPEEALGLLKKSTKEKYESHFNIPREIAFLEEYLRTK
jgi:8-oxo-dGTP diphosphatase